MSRASRGQIQRRQEKKISQKKQDNKKRKKEKKKKNIKAETVQTRRSAGRPRTMQGGEEGVEVEDGRMF